MPRGLHRNIKEENAHEEELHPEQREDDPHPREDESLPEKVKKWAGSFNDKAKSWSESHAEKAKTYAGIGMIALSYAVIFGGAAMEYIKGQLNNDI